jgi:hypothetical protein
VEKHLLSTEKLRKSEDVPLFTEERTPDTMKLSGTK